MNITIFKQSYFGWVVGRVCVYQLGEVVCALDILCCGSRVDYGYERHTMIPFLRLIDRIGSKSNVVELQKKAIALLYRQWKWLGHALIACV